MILTNQKTKTTTALHGKQSSIINHNLVTTTNWLVSIEQQVLPEVVVKTTFGMQTLGNTNNYNKTEL